MGEVLHEEFSLQMNVADVGGGLQKVVDEVREAGLVNPRIEARIEGGRVALNVFEEHELSYREMAERLFRRAVQRGEVPYGPTLFENAFVGLLTELHLTIEPGEDGSAKYFLHPLEGELFVEFNGEGRIVALEYGLTDEFAEEGAKRMRGDLTAKEIARATKALREEGKSIEFDGYQAVLMADATSGHLLRALRNVVGAVVIEDGQRTAVYYPKEDDPATDKVASPQAAD